MSTALYANLHQPPKIDLQRRKVLLYFVIDPTHKFHTLAIMQMCTSCFLYHSINYGLVTALQFSSYIFHIVSSILRIDHVAYYYLYRL